MNLGIIAHNSKKVLIEDFCIAYKNILAKHEVYATGTTGRRIEEATSLHVHKFLAGSIGGDKQFMEMVERQDLDMVILFYNPVMMDPVEPDIYILPLGTVADFAAWTDIEADDDGIGSGCKHNVGFVDGTDGGVDDAHPDFFIGQFLQ